MTVAPPITSVMVVEIEAEWMAFLTLEVAGPQVREEIEEARQHDLDNDDDAFQAATTGGARQACRVDRERVPRHWGEARRQ